MVKTSVLFSITYKNTFFYLPVNPQNIEFHYPNSNERYNIIELGEINIAGLPGLCTFEISSFIPRQSSLTEYQNSSYGYGPLSTHGFYIDFFKAIMQDQATILVNIGGLENDFDAMSGRSFKVLVDDFKYSYRDGSGDMYYTVSFSEWRPFDGALIKTPNVSPSTGPTPEIPNDLLDLYRPGTGSKATSSNSGNTGKRDENPQPPVTEEVDYFVIGTEVDILGTPWTWWNNNETVDAPLLYMPIIYPGGPNSDPALGYFVDALNQRFGYKGSEDFNPIWTFQGIGTVSQYYKKGTGRSDGSPANITHEYLVAIHIKDKTGKWNYPIAYFDKKALKLKGTS